MDADLPNLEPRPEVKNPRQERKYKWVLLKTLCYFCVAYASIHKFFVPVVLKLSSLKNSLYSTIDYSFVVAVFLAWHLYFHNRLGRLGSMACGALVAVAGVETHNVLGGKYPGWLSISHSVASLPLALVAVFLLTFESKGRRIGYAWLGVGIVVVVFLSPFKRFFGLTQFPLAQVQSQHSMEISESKTTEKKPGLSLVEAQKLCGTNSLVLDLVRVDRDIRAQSLSRPTLEIRDCGLRPSVIVVESMDSVFLITNHTKRAVNLHVIKGWNMLIPPLTTQQSQKFHSANVFGSVSMVFSDSSPQVGLSAIVFKNLLDSGHVVSFERNPPRVNEFFEKDSP